jgi:hypothetical protein
MEDTEIGDDKKKREEERENTISQDEKKQSRQLKELRINVNLNHGKDIAKFLLLSRRRDIGLNCWLVHNIFCIYRLLGDASSNKTRFTTKRNFLTKCQSQFCIIYYQTHFARMYS